jgi:hypothetical protein
MKYISLLLLLGCLGCDLNKEINPDHNNRIPRLDRIYEIDMGTTLYYTYVMRDRITSQEVICTVGSCYLTGRKIDGKGNEVK